jgi:glycerol-3-phosphate dehydrogenase
MLGARAGLQMRPVAVEKTERPAVLARCRGVARLDEQVIDPVSLIADLAGQHADHLRRIDIDSGLSFELGGPATVQTIHLQDPGSGASAILRTQAIVLCAGTGNAGLRGAVGLEETAQQRRPLRMVMVRGDLPEIAGHCVDGARTRVTITWARDSAGRVVWQLGGEVAETGVGRSPAEVLAHASAELAAVLPDLDQTGCEWASYLVDRAEAASGGKRPEDVSVLCEGNVITAWPTKLVLAPRLAEVIVERLAETPRSDTDKEGSPLPDWPRPQVALPPWECETKWTADV